jgi:hypothetical protein
MEISTIDYQSLAVGTERLTARSDNIVTAVPNVSYPCTSILKRCCVATVNLLGSTSAKALSVALIVPGTVALGKGVAVTIAASLVASGGALLATSAAVSISRCISNYSAQQSEVEDLPQQSLATLIDESTNLPVVLRNLVIDYASKSIGESLEGHSVSSYRGDPGLFALMQEELNGMAMPASREAYEKTLYSAYKKLVGSDLLADLSKNMVYGPALGDDEAHGGMSAGWINPQAWLALFKELADEHFPD